MRKNILILVASGLLFGFFNSSNDDFKSWNNPSQSLDYMPALPITAETNISIFGMITNFFSDFTLNYPSTESYSQGSSSDYKRYVRLADRINNQTDEEVNDVAKEEVEKRNQEFSKQSPRIVEYVPEEKVRFVPEPVVKQQPKVVVKKPVVKVPVIDSTLIKDSIAAAEAAELERQLQEAKEAAIRAKKEEELRKKRAAEREKRRIAQKRQSIIDNGLIKDNAKELILESIDSGIITYKDIDDLLDSTSPKVLKKKQVKQLLKSRE